MQVELRTSTPRVLYDDVIKLYCVLKINQYILYYVTYHSFCFVFLYYSSYCGLRSKIWKFLLHLANVLNEKKEEITAKISNTDKISHPKINKTYIFLTVPNILRIWRSTHTDPTTEWMFFSLPMCNHTICTRAPVSLTSRQLFDYRGEQSQQGKTGN